MIKTKAESEIEKSEAKLRKLEAFEMKEKKEKEVSRAKSRFLKKNWINAVKMYKKTGL